MKYTKAQLIDALCAEWDYLCHDDFDPENTEFTDSPIHILIGELDDGKLVRLRLNNN